MKTVLGIVPAREGSKRLPNKNMLEINGIPLVMIAYDTLCLSNTNRVYISTNIQDVYKKIDEKNIIWRPPELSEDDVPLQHTINWTYKKIKKIEKTDYDIIVVLLPNCPGINSSHVNKAVDKLIECNLNIVRSYTIGSGIESGLIVARRDYYLANNIDVYCGCILTSNREIHTMDDYLFAKEIYEI